MKTLQELEKEFKQCVDCKIYKRFSEFGKNNTRKNGIHYYCKQCSNIRQINNRNTKDQDADYYSERLARKNSNYIKSKKSTLASINYRKRNPEKDRAQQNLRNHVKSGHIIKKPCQICGDENSEGHHEDYSKQLEVIWLCRTHHREIHRKFNTIKERLNK